MPGRMEGRGRECQRFDYANSARGFPQGGRPKTSHGWQVSPSVPSMDGWLIGASRLPPRCCGWRIAMNTCGASSCCVSCNNRDTRMKAWAKVFCLWMEGRALRRATLLVDRAMAWRKRAER